MQKLLTLILGLVWCGAYSQGNNLVSVIDTSVDPAGVIQELKLPPAPTTGNIYIFDDWYAGNIVLDGNIEIKGQLLRYDLKHKTLEIKLAEGVKVCPLDLLASFNWFDKNLNDSTYFVNISHVPDQTEFYDRGVLQILYENKATLYKQYHLEFQESTYVPALDMGRRSNKIIKKSTLILQNSGKMYPLAYKLKKNKTVFGEAFEEVEKYAKDNKLKVKNEDDLIGIVKHYNLLLENQHQLP